VNGVTRAAAKVATDGHEIIRMHGMVSMTVEDAVMTAMMILNDEIANAAAKADTDHSPLRSAEYAVDKDIARVGKCNSICSLQAGASVLLAAKSSSTVSPTQSRSTNGHKYTHVKAITPLTFTLTPM